MLLLWSFLILTIFLMAILNFGGYFWPTCYYDHDNYNDPFEYVFPCEIEAKL